MEKWCISNKTCFVYKKAQFGLFLCFFTFVYLDLTNVPIFVSMVITFITMKGERVKTIFQAISFASTLNTCIFVGYGFFFLQHINSQGDIF